MLSQGHMFENYGRNPKSDKAITHVRLSVNLALKFDI